MTMLVADRGDLNIFDLDANVPIDGAQDELIFTAKRRRSDTDAAAVAQVGMNVAPIPAGIVVTDGPNGKFQVQLPSAVLKDVEDSALIWDCQLKDASQGADGYFTLDSGEMRLTGEVTKST